MPSIRTFAPAAASLALILILAACAPATASPPSAEPTPTAPTPTAPTPSAPAPSETPTPAPSETPAVVEHELPFIGHSTADGVAVRTLPSADAPLVVGERSDLSKVPDIRLSAGEQVFVTLGPVVADGYSWYQVQAVDGGDVYWEFGWVAGEFLAVDDPKPNYDPVTTSLHGQGRSGSAEAQVVAGSPLTIVVAASPMDGAESCTIEVTVIGTDGSAVNVATETLTDAEVIRLSPTELPSLFQEEAGTATLEIDSDCSFAGSITLPQF